ncbi:MAG TPA: OB-fold nucleic acid binding domain-containing protein, partial [Parapedobacter sp.]|nr:OB-fold nucleic acid binding domain-containing protein [Parapedobacter sp.]
MAPLSTITPIEYLKGVGPARAVVLKEELNIHTFGDLLRHYPFRYIDRTRFHKINQLQPEMTAAQVIGRLVHIEELGERRGKRLIGHFRDDTGTMELVWFQSIGWLKKSLQVGAAYICYGKPTVFNNQLSITHPEMEVYKPGNGQQGNPSLQPVYNTTEKLRKFSLDSKGIQKLQVALLESIAHQLAEMLPDYLVQQYQLTPLPQALVAVHFPRDSAELAQAIHRLKFDELFFIQLKLLRNKLLNTRKFKGHRFETVGDRFNRFYHEQLPFALTNAQKRVIKEIRRDTASGAQLNRLVQGDVGSGKTVVA